MSQDLQERVREALAPHLDTSVVEVKPLVGGACQDLFRVDLAEGEAWVLRSDAARSLPSSLGRAQEFHVARAAAAAGVNTPEPRWLSEGLVAAGAWAYFLPWVEGEALGGRIVRHPGLAEARAALPAALAHELRAIHAVVPGEDAELDAALGTPPADAAQAAVASVRGMLDTLPQRRPALELALRWLERNAPSAVAPSLVHGDFRLGNLLVTPAGLSGVLDWEFARWGDPCEDLAWFCLRDWRFGNVKLAAGGIATREDWLARYAEEGGREVEPDRLAFWEVCGNLRWAAGARFQAERYRSGEARDLELLAIGWRALEMEYETLRQIERSA
jgi:aminoglycoside phosphotransferase (APT) family kinase protein